MTVDATRDEVIDKFLSGKIYKQHFIKMYDDPTNMFPIVLELEKEGLVKRFIESSTDSAETVIFKWIGPSEWRWPS